MPRLSNKPAYIPHGAAWKLLHCQAPEVLISGPAGGGKSCACLIKIHLCAEAVGGFRGLVVRKTRESLTESALVTFERFVVPENHPCLAGAQRRMRQVYRYPNGSEIIIGGLDKPGKIMSTEYDMAFVQEAIELTEDAWEMLTTRLRNNKLPYQQLIADTNPDRPTHWLKMRCDAGKTTLLESRHEDNPLLWDRQAKAYTPFGVKYMEKLDALSGPRKLRLRDGKWVQAEGVVYDDWNAAVHVIDRIDIPESWPRYWVIDFGYTNPFTCQFWAEDPDGRLYLYREIYLTKRLVEDHAKRILKLVGAVRLADGTIGWASARESRPRAIICDHDAEDRATLERHLGMGTVPAAKSVSPGIQAVAARLRIAGDGRPRILVLRDSLDERDPMLVDAKKPMCLADEMDGYTWDTSAGRKCGEEPVKRDDHACDAMRYMVAYKDMAVDASVKGEIFLWPVPGELATEGKQFAIAGPKCQWCIDGCERCVNGYTQHVVTMEDERDGEWWR